MTGTGQGAVRFADMLISDLKPRALAAGDDLDLMFDVIENVVRCTDATETQLQAALAAKRSLQSLRQSASETRVQVARVRFAKLAAIL